MRCRAFLTDYALSANGGGQAFLPCPRERKTIIPMKERLFKGKSKRTKIFSLITILLLVAVIGLNLVLTYFGVQKTIFFDMTPEGLYTLSDAMKDECDEMVKRLREEGADKKITVTFCTDPDYLIASEDSRLTYFMALKLKNRYPDYIEVKTENVFLNPTSVSQYKTTSLSKIEPNDVIVSYGDRYRIASHNYFWVNGKSEHDYYNGEYRIATMMRSVTAIAHPVAYFLTDHGESYYDPENPGSDMSKSLSEFPFHVNVLYYGPQNFGPMVPFCLQDTGYVATMIGFPYDHLKGWRSIYPEDVYEQQMYKVCEGFRKGLEMMQPFAGLSEKADELMLMTQAALCQYESACHHITFVKNRGEDASVASRENRQVMLAMVREERRTVRELIKLRLRDSRIGYESSNHYFYTLQDLWEKLLNLEYCEKALR